jgi:sulfur carrier protein ThiS
VRIEVEHQGETHAFDAQDPITIDEVLESLGIPSSTVLAVHDDVIVPHTSVISADLRLELVVVSSGG